MTTKDMARLERQMEQMKTDRHRGRRRRMWQGAAAAGAVTGVVLGAMALRNDPQPEPQAAGPAPSPILQLTGLWRLDEDASGAFQAGDAAGRWLWYFLPDGSLANLSTAQELVSPEPGDWKYVASADGFSVTSMDRSSSNLCDQRWQATVSTEGRMRARVEAATPNCVFKVGEPAVFTRISPMSGAGAALTSSLSRIAPVPVTNMTALRGTWLLKGTGQVLAVDGSDSFVLRDFGSPDTGWTRRPGRVNVVGGSVFFTDRACTAEYSATTRNSTLHAIPKPGTCRLLGDRDTLIRLTD